MKNYLMKQPLTIKMLRKGLAYLMGALSLSKFIRYRKIRLIAILGIALAGPILAVSAITPNGIFLNLKPSYYLSVVATTAVGLALLASLYGWGGAIFRMFRMPGGSLPYQLIQGVLGLALYIMVGGLLNVFHATTVLAVYSLVGFGLLFAALDLRHRWKPLAEGWKRTILPLRTLDKGLIFLTVSLVSVYFVRGANSQVWNAHDDENGYIVFAEKIRQTGGLGLDPYSERRLVSSLGGQSFLDSIVLFFRPVSALHLFDFGVGFLLCVLIIAGLAKANTFPIKWASVLMVFFTVMPNQSMNITSTYTSIAFLLGLFVIVTSNQGGTIVKNFLLFGLLSGAAFTLKNSLAPFLLALGFYYLLSAYLQNRDIGKAFKALVVLLGSFLVVVIPWGASLFLSNGTLFYPLLGKGNHGSNYGNFNYLEHVSLQTLVTEFIKNCFYSGELLTIGLICLLMLFLPTMCKFNNFERWHSWAIFLIVIVSGSAIHYGTATFGTLRYMFPMLIGSAIFLVLWAGGKNIKTGIVALVVLVSLSSAINFASAGSSLTNFLGSRIFINGLDPKVEIDRKNTLKLQSFVPPGETILARLGRNYLFDFNRNQIWIADYPGAASPEPGLPIFEGGLEMREYLLNKRIRYVAFRYSDLFTREVYEGRLLEAPWSWVRVEAENAFAFQDNLSDLATKYRVPYDDGEQMLIDLQLSK
jgi:hypothetical protein